MKIISEKLISKDLNIDSKDKLFNKIASLLEKEKLIFSKKNIVKELWDREEISSTAFENGLIIPHARSSSIKKTTIVIVEFKDSNFQSIDGQKSNFAVAIIVPEKAKTDHLKVLSKVSSLLSTKEKLIEFKKLSKVKKVELLNNISLDKDFKENNLSSKYDFVAVTSCAAGIAHTYMAKDALLDAAKKMGLKTKVETRGAATENKLSSKDIDNAKFVIIAADVTISKRPFYGKKILMASTNDAIRDAKSLIEKAPNEKISYGKGDRLGKLQLGATDKKNKLGKAIMGALSFMIPVTIVGGILMAIPNALAAGGNSQGGTWSFPNDFTEALWKFGHIGLLLMVPILSMFLAYKIAGKPAMPAALIGGYFINSGELMGKYSLIDLPGGIGGSASAGFLGGMAVGIIVGYMVNWMRWIKWHRSIAPVANLMFVPLISSFSIFIIILYVIGSPMTWIMSQLYSGLSSISSSGIWVNILIGMLFAGLIAIDLGGPINKTALAVATIIFADTLKNGNTNFVPQTAVQAAISVPPLGMWFATIIFRKRFSNSERAAGKAALPMGLVGISEGALPFAFKSPLKAIIANVSGALLAGGLVSLFKINFYGGLGSPLGAYIGYSTNNFFGLTWIFSIFSGALLTGIIFGLFTRKNLNYEKNYLQIKQEKNNKHKTLGLDTKFKVIFHNIKKVFKVLPSKLKYSINPKNWIQKPTDWDEEDEL